MPSISVIVPVHQGEAYLKNCVESVRMQSFQDWELLLVDDGSTDASPAICDECAREDDRIRVFHRRKSSGTGEARNLGLREAKGEFIAFLDVDDRYEFQALETLWSLQQQSGADTVGCAHLNLAADGSKTEVKLLEQGVYDDAAIRERIVAPLLGDRLMPPVFNGSVWRYLFSAKVIRSAHLSFQGNYRADELFVMEYFCNAKKLAVTEQVLYRFFLNPSSRHGYQKDFYATFRRFMERKKALAKQYDLEGLRPQWQENNNWVGLLAAVENEYSRENPIPVRKKQRAVEELCRQEEIAQAIASITPQGLHPRRQMAANLIKGGHFFTLTQMYRLQFGI